MQLETKKIETPIQRVIGKIETLVRGEYSAEQYKVSLQELLHWLGAINVYAPVHATVLSDPSLDEPTRAYLELEFLSKVRNQSDVFIERQHLRNPIALPVASKQKATEAFEKLDRIDFDVFKMSQEQLMKAVLVIFDASGVIEEFDIDRGKLWNFVQRVAGMYKSANPYHNFTHAVDVLQFGYVCLQSMKTRMMITDTDVLALLFSSLVHDLAHPGVTNSFLTYTEDKIALVYNDSSVLENFHCSKAFELLKEPECNFLHHMSKPLYKQVRDSVIAMILATDMSRHFEIVSKFQARTKLGLFSAESMEDRKLLLSMLIKCSDISNVVRPLHIVDQWSSFLLEEFFKQGDLERAQGTQISQYMDRNSINKRKMQLGFIDYIASPLFEVLAETNDEFQVHTQQLRSYRAQLE